VSTHGFPHSSNFCLDVAIAVGRRAGLFLRLWRHYRVFDALRDPEFDDFPGRDLDGFAGRRISTNSHFPIHSAGSFPDGITQASGKSK
jgi:hypothetical protein